MVSCLINFDWRMYWHSTSRALFPRSGATKNTNGKPSNGFRTIGMWMRLIFPKCWADPLIRRLTCWHQTIIFRRAWSWALRKLPRKKCGLCLLHCLMRVKMCLREWMHSRCNRPFFLKNTETVRHSTTSTKTPSAHTFGCATRTSIISTNSVR